MVDTVQHPMTTRHIPLIPASNQMRSESRHRDKKKFAGRHGQDSVTNSGDEEIKPPAPLGSEESSGAWNSDPKRKKIDIIV